MRPADGTNLRLEGLRAIAILVVVIYHLDLPVLTGGFVGVDVFFVLSGYLITTLLVRERDRSGDIDLTAFWIRRIRRLLPASVLVIGVTVLCGALLLSPERLHALLTTALAALTYTANLRFIAWSVDYYAAMAVLDPLLHMWSLGVEAQFYLAWPLLLLVTPKRLRIPAMAVISGASLALSVALSPVDQPLAFYGLPTRVWELGAGGLLAVAAVRGPAWLGYAGLAAIALASLAYDGTTLFPGIAALLPVAGSAAVIAAPPGWLASGLLVWTGQRSYAWYLWHWPLILLSDSLAPGPLTRIAAAALALVLADWSFRHVEQPLRAKRVMP
jgi:peptidoglycan/LPS O-acetylase OafA/YrhL